jgi:hypothetical protein
MLPVNGCGFGAEFFPVMCTPFAIVLVPSWQPA